MAHRTSPIRKLLVDVLRGCLPQPVALPHPMGFSAADECKTHLCFKFISHAILSILYPYSFKTHNISSKLGFEGFLMESK